MNEATEPASDPSNHPSPRPYVGCVSVTVNPECVDDFIPAVLENARETRRETGNVRFDVLQAEEDPIRFFLYECYLSKTDFAIHQQTPHYLKWKAAVAEMMARPRQGVRHHSLFFGDD